MRSTEEDNELRIFMFECGLEDAQRRGWKPLEEECKRRLGVVLENRKLYELEEQFSKPEVLIKRPRFFARVVKFFKPLKSKSAVKCLGCHCTCGTALTVS